MSILGFSFTEPSQRNPAADPYARRLQKISGCESLSTPDVAPLVPPLLLKTIAALALVAALAVVTAILAIYFPAKPL